MNIDISELKRKLIAVYISEIAAAKGDMVSAKNLSIKVMKDIHKFFGLKKCSPCSKYIGFWSGRKSWEVGERFYCERCVRVNFKVCEYCHKIVDRLRTVEGKNKSI